MFTTKRKGIIAILCAVFAAALIACAISLAPSATRTAPVYAAEGDVAAIGDTNYTSLKGAIDAAGDTATTITLLTNTAENITIASGQDITLALNGKDITVESGDVITNNGTLKITGIALSDVSTGDGYAVSNAGTLVIEGGAYRNDIYSANENVEISGGVNCRLYSIVPADFLADGYTLSYYTAGYFCPYAAASVAQITRGGVEYVFRNLTAADAGAIDGDTIKLLNDITTTGSIDKDNAITLSKSVTLDLCGFDITFTATNYSNNLIGVTGENVVITNSSEKESKLINEYGEGGNAYSVIHSEGANLTIENVTIESNANGVVFFGSLTPAAASVADPVTFNTLNMEGVTVNSYAFALSGNGSSAEDEAWSGTAIDITNSSLNSKQGCAIYQPQYGILNINGEETFIEGSSGIEVRAGILNVNAGTIRANWPEFAFSDNAGGGSSVDGAAIVVSQHSTNLPISVNLNGGTYSSTSAGGMSVYEADLLNDVATDKIEIAIDGGEYTQPVESKNVKGFVENGTFSEALPASYVSENAVFYPVETEKGVAYTATTNTGDLSSELSVAQIGNAYYATLQEAVAAAESGATVTLIDNVSEDIVVDEGQAITLDLSGKTLANVIGHTITNSGTLTIVDSGENGTVDNISNGRGALVNYGTATLNGGTFTRSLEAGTYEPYGGNGNSWYTLKNYGCLTINEGSTVTTRLSDGEKAVGGFSSLIANGYQDSTDYNDNKDLVTVTENEATVVINGGSFSGGINTLKNDEGSTAEINGGTFINVTQAAVQNWNKLTITGGTFNAENDNVDAVITGCWESDIGSNGTSVIEGGVFNGAVTYIDGYSGGIDYEISGGTFCEVVDADYIAEGSVFYPAEDGSYKVVTEEEFETVTDNAGVALMNGVVYDSLADAVDAAPTDGTQVTITLIDTDGDGIVTGLGVKVVEGKNIVIDFDGLTYDVTNPVGSPGTETNGFQLLKGSTVKMMNGTLVSDTAKILIQNYCDLTIDDMTLDMSDCGQVQYVISNNSGNTVITGDTTIVAAPNQVAFDIYYWPGNGYTDGVSVTFDENFTGTVTGTVQYGTDSTGEAEDNWQTNKANLAIENGTFDITFDVYSGEETEAAITISGGKFTTKFSDSYLADGYALSEYNGYYIPISSSTDGTLLEEIAQLRQEIDEAIAAINGELEGGDAATLAEAVTALIGKMNELEDKIAELDENMVTDADLQALRNSITVAYNAAVSRVRAELSAQISDLRDSMAEMGDVSGQLDELKAAYEAADALLSADIDSVSAALAELESTYKAADDAIWNAIYALRDADSGMTTALWVIGVIAVLALCAGVAGVAFAIVRTKRS